MQTALKLFQLLPNKGGTFEPGIRKIAVKLPLNERMTKRNSDLDATGFMDIMNALMPATAEQLKASLQGLEWVPLDAAELNKYAGEVSENGQSIPLIDLTGGGKGNHAMLKMLMELLPQQDVSSDFQGLAMNPGASEIADANVTGSDLTEKTLKVLDVSAKNPPINVLTQKPGDTTAVKDAALFSLQTAVEQSDIENASATRLLDRDATTPKIPSIEQHKATIEVTRNPTMVDPAIIREAFKKVVDQSSPRAAMESSADQKKQVTDNFLSRAGMETSTDQKQVVDQIGEKSDHGNKTSNHSTGLKNRVDLTSQNNFSQQKPVSEPSTFQTENQGLLRRSVAENRVNLAAAKQGLEESFKTETSSSMLRDTAQPELPPTRLNTAPMERTGSEPVYKETDVPLPRDMQNDVIRQIVSRMNLRNDNGQSQMHIKLKPEFLGNLRLHITTENHQVMIRMTAESTAVKDMIEQNVQVLKNELQQHGLHIDKFDVFVGTDNEAWRHRQQQASRQNQNNKRLRRAQLAVEGLSKEDIDPLATTAPRRGNNNSLSEIDFFA